MSYETILFEQSSPLAEIKINRPKIRNALNLQFWQELGDALDRLAKITEVRMLVISAAGSCFSAGADLKESKTRSLSDYEHYLNVMQQRTKQLYFLNLPTIAVLHGYALGSGLELALACDLRIASNDAVLGFPEAKVCSSATCAASLLLPRLIGPARARELLFTSRYISAERAEQIGLLNHCVPESELLSAKKSMCQSLLGCSLVSQQLIKQGIIMSEAQQACFDQVLTHETKAVLEAVNQSARSKAIEKF